MGAGFPGKPTRFTTRWGAFVPLGIACDGLAGPFEGSKFFLYYTPSIPRTGVSVVGEFTSKTIPTEWSENAVRQFFSLEFDEDRQAVRDRAWER